MEHHPSSPRRIVVALGGNALGTTPDDQKAAIRETAGTIAGLAAEGHHVVIGHGNGPQVGLINQAFSMAHAAEADVPNMPFAECSAMSQGYIGFHIQQALRNQFAADGITRDVTCVVTEVEVDPADTAFTHPTKPIGLFYSEAEAAAQREQLGYRFMEDAGRGYRRVVPSPMPKHIVQLPAIDAAIKAGAVVIACGGGGIPVIRQNGAHVGVDAVIDKDYACARLAGEVDADTLLILTGVDHVFVNFGTPDQRALDRISVAEAQDLIEKGQFGTGSMLPKVQACVQFVLANPRARAIITSLEAVGSAIHGEGGTLIVR